MIQLSGIRKTYPGPSGVEALRGVDLHVAAGEAFGIIGPSGAGKSTLLRCINLLERPTSGRVIVDGDDLTALAEPELRRRRRSIGMIFQHFALLSSRTAAANVALPLELAGRSRAETDAAVREALAFVGLEDRADAYPATLSGGQQQRVGIARALAGRPRVLLCDEATSALDPRTTESILALLQRVHRELGMTIVAITHEMAVIKALCERVAFLDDGRIVESGPVRDVFLRPSAAARAFVDATSPDRVAAMLDVPLLPAAPTAGANVVWRLGFGATAAGEPVVTGLVRRFPLDLTIVGGTIERVGDEPLGVLVVEVRASDAVREEALRWLEHHGVVVETVGYVERTIDAAS